MQKPEDLFTVTVTDTSVTVEHPQRKTESVDWDDIQAILLVNTDQGPWQPDVWLTLVGKNSGCLIPQGSKGFDEVYDIVSKYPDFDFGNAIKSAACAENAEFLLWKRK
jgi:hypothetical protein